MKILGAAAIAAMLFASTAQAAVTSYATRADFLAANPGVATETFSAMNVASGTNADAIGVLNSSTNNSLFTAGSLLGGFTMSTTTGGGAPGSNDIYAGNNCCSDPGTVVSSNNFGENILITFAPNIGAFAVDLNGFEGVDGAWTLTLNSAGGPEGVFNLPTGGFFGISSTVGLISVYLDKPDTGGVLTNLSFGPAGGAVPEPAAWALLILGFGGVGAVLRRRREELGLAA